jgi:hypothetical protein
MTTDEEIEPSDEQAYTWACTRAATKRHLRKRRIRDAALGVMALVAAGVPWLLKFEGSSILVWYVGMFVALAYEQTERRLKTMQIRLARMHDLLHRIAGNHTSDEELMELVSEDGPVEPDPELWPSASRRRARSPSR